MQIRPFHRIYRPIKDKLVDGYSDWAYIQDKQYSKNPTHYIQSYKIIQKDFINLLEYVEPADINLNTYSFRIMELIIKICIEIEANFKAILRENDYNPIDKKGDSIPEKKWNIYDYKKIVKSNLLDKYKIIIPNWKGDNGTISPYENWIQSNDLDWYSTYNTVKHDRNDNFCRANFNTLIKAMTGFQILLTSQYRDQDFSSSSTVLSVNGYDYYEGESTIGEYFRIIYPENIDENDYYSFNWTELSQEQCRFEKYKF